MISNPFKLVLIVFIALLSCSKSIAQIKVSKISNFNSFSERFLGDIRNGKNTKTYQDRLASTSLEDLSEGLNTDSKRLAFWVNIYNAYIQVFLSKNPELYEGRQAFFNQDRILIAGEKISFAKIEHGIIRKSQWSLGLGRIPKFFVNKFERKLRVKERDYRIHFALNCGAKDCPPVAIYEAARLDEQFNKSTEMFLKRTTDFDIEALEVTVTPLFSWFRGDFGNKRGVKNILKEQNLIPTTKNINIDYKNYDWTLNLDNWIEL